MEQNVYPYELFIVYVCVSLPYFFFRMPGKLLETWIKGLMLFGKCATYFFSHYVKNVKLSLKKKVNITHPCNWFWGNAILKIVFV